MHISPLRGKRYKKEKKYLTGCNFISNITVCHVKIRTHVELTVLRLRFHLIYIEILYETLGSLY